MPAKKTFLRIYLIIALAFGVVGLGDNTFTFLSNKFSSAFAVLNFNHEIYTLALAALSFIFFFFNLTSIVAFKYQHLEKIAYVLPLYHLINNLLFVGVGLILTRLNSIPDWAWAGIIAAGIICSLFEVGFSIFLLKTIKFSPEVSP